MPDSPIFGGDKTLFFLSLFLSYNFLTFFSFSKLFLSSIAGFSLPYLCLHPIKVTGSCMISICHTDVLLLMLGHQNFTQKIWRHRLCLFIFPCHTRCAGVCQCSLWLHFRDYLPLQILLKKEKLLENNLA